MRPAAPFGRQFRRAGCASRVRHAATQAVATPIVTSDRRRHSRPYRSRTAVSVSSLRAYSTPSAYAGTARQPPPGSRCRPSSR